MSRSLLIVYKKILSLDLQNSFPLQIFGSSLQTP